MKEDDEQNYRFVALGIVILFFLMVSTGMVGHLVSVWGNHLSRQVQEKCK